MKILHITKKYPNALGGDAVAVSNLEKQQLAQGHEVVVLTSNCDEITADDKHFKFGFRDTPASLDTITPRRLASLGTLFFKSFSIIRKERPDVVHTHSIDMAFASSFATRWLKVPMVHTFHILTFPDAHHGFLRRKTELLFLKGARPQLVTAPNEVDIEHLRKASVKNARLLTNGIDLSFWKRRKRAHDVFTFITVARLEDQKGIEYLIRAVATLKKTKEPFRLLVVGDGSLRVELETLAKRLKLADIIAFVGRKTPEEVRDLYATSDAMVIPSLWESGPLTSFEAWAMKLPLVITKVGMFANESAKSERAIVVKIGDCKALVKPMEELLTDTKKRNALIRAGLEAVQRHTWAKMAEAANALYLEARDIVRIQQRSVATLKLNKRVVLSCVGAAAVFLLAVAHCLSPTINTLVTLPLVVLAPGLLFISLNWPQQARKPALMVSIGMAMGLLIIALEGAVLNWLLPVLGIQQPLQSKYLAPLHILVIIGLLTAYLQKPSKKEDAVCQVPFNLRYSTFAVLPLLLPLLSTIGAFRLNNGAGDLFTMISFAAVTAAALWYVWKPKLWNASWLLFNMALALLLSTSLRGWYTGGFDVSQEYQVYQIALQHHYWNLHALPGNAYNACLSLTTLPVALQQFTHVGAGVIFRFFYQVVFALTGVLTYLIARRFIHNRLAFLAAFLYMAQAQFIDTMPQIVRQEVGFLFFGLLVYFLFDNVELTRRRKSLLISLSLGMVVMHYSTTYIAILMFGVSAVLLWVAHLLHWRVSRVPKLYSHLKPMTLVKLAVLLFLLSTLWYVQINNGASDAYGAMRKAITHLPTTFDSKSNKAQVLLGGTVDATSSKDVGQYADSIHEDGKIHPVSVPSLPVKSHVGETLTSLGRTALSIILKVILPISPFILLIYKRTRKDAVELSFVSLGAIVVFIAVLALPSLSASYNFQRVYQQCLIVLSVAGLWALWEMLPAKNETKTVVLTVFTISFFLLSPGSALANQVVGGGAPRMSFNNYGEEYDQYYVSQGDVLAAGWLGSHCQGDAPWADKYASLRLTAYGAIPFDSIRNDILAAKKGCLYLDGANIHTGLYYAEYKKLAVRYTTPISSFVENDLIYSNGNAKIYKYAGSTY